MVKERKAPRHKPAKKALSKEFNLLYPGTGIRFAALRDELLPKKTSAPLIRFGVLLLLLAGAAALFLAHPQQEEPKAANIVTPPPPPPQLMTEEPVAPDAVPVVDGTAPQAGTAMNETSVSEAAAPVPAKLWRIRFGIFLMRENADRYAVSLNEKGIAAAAETTTHTMPSWTIEAGPVETSKAWERLKETAAKLNVAPIEEVDAKYLLIGPIWLKDRALAVQKKLKAIGAQSTIAEARKEREVFKVLSADYGSADAARQGMAEMKSLGIEGVIDE